VKFIFYVDSTKLISITIKSNLIQIKLEIMTVQNMSADIFNFNLDPICQSI